MCGAVVVEEKKAEVPAESEVTAEEPIVSEPIAAEPVPEIEAETPKETAAGGAEFSVC